MKNEEIVHLSEKKKVKPIIESSNQYRSSFKEFYKENYLGSDKDILGSSNILQKMLFSWLNPILEVNMLITLLVR